jgi:thioredoxin-related protein
MKRKNLLILISGLIFCIGTNLHAQTGKIELYKPNEDASKQIDGAISRAAKEKKHVLLQIGGNWCPWCIMLHKFYADEPQIDSILKADYIVEYINFSKENKNLDVLAKLEFPQRFGFPVLVILDTKGKRLHTQNTSYLEEGKGYNKAKVLDFLKSWSPNALNPALYKE